MSYSTIKLDRHPYAVIVTIDRIAQRNSINAALLSDLHQLLDEVERDVDCKIIVLQGQQGFFCTGMDFEAMVADNEAAQDNVAESAAYMRLLHRFATLPRIVIAKVEGTAMAGGIGLVAASDLVIATPNSQFSLSEALWGLLPCCVLPYLIRRIGFQAAYRLTLTTQAIDGKEAQRVQLVDELTEQPDDILRRLLLRLSRLEVQTLHDMKAYFRRLWFVDEAMEKVAVEEISRLTQTPQVQENIENFVKHQRFPWDKGA
ncbi:MAG: enoyl-CoA hydratase [Thiotrichales bacterium]|nr:MAG: enoyl-CoA hydratase [Thiotrichales bacterium]